MIDVFSDYVIAAIRAEWETAVVQPPPDLPEWEAALSSMSVEYQEILRAGRWQRGPSEFFGVLGISRSELAHCSMIAWLLDPEGRHGLGRQFLDRVIGSFLPDLDHHNLRVRSVATEVQRMETRADIVVWGDLATLIIEAKVDAAEGWRQCDRLFERFSGERDARFVFLTPSGQPPMTATGPARDAFIPLSYREIADCLESAITSVRVNEGSSNDDMAANYLRTLRRQFT